MSHNIGDSACMNKSKCDCGKSIVIKNHKYCFTCSYTCKCCNKRQNNICVEEIATEPYYCTLCSANILTYMTS